MLVSSNEVKEMIAAGKPLIIAGEENLLSGLPAGNWIGGTIPYFMAEEGGVITREKLYVTEIPSFVQNASVAWYKESDLSLIPKNAPENGFSVVIIPATSPAHISYAQNAPNYEGIFMKPVIGWISGVHLDDLGTKKPKVFAGDRRSSSEEAVVMHCTLPQGKVPQIGIINLFKQGNGDTITFTKDGFSADTAVINGESRNFADYIKEKKIDIRLPLVADYCGTMVNVSFQAVNEETRTVELYAPVFRDVEYRVAAPVTDYVREFSNAVSVGSSIFACNCILNFIYSELEGKKLDITGPVTFGEIAYQLLNQTLVYLEIIDV